MSELLLFPATRLVFTRLCFSGGRLKCRRSVGRPVVHWVVQLSHQLLWCTLNWKLMCCDSTVFKELRLWDFLLVCRRAADVFFFFFIATARSLTSTKSGLDRFLGGFFSSYKTLQLIRSHQRFSLLSVFNNKCWDLPANYRFVSCCKFLS